ncbi:conserved hypothetical protein [Culex quinquefasciatus]|uniref:LITAF domain-containing protein n=1 Tax=Culex quinquefasciatus TaxID=7176 RepID=B0X8G4_CULQU|nr:conserved hypothetical protein [Culex quinquefasciatus]|eukprot:XP_001865936.1 conserved hypothetical protein [Culex quinquefasciatus]
MSNVATCSICKEVLPYNRSHTSLLIQHLIEQHPDQPFKLVRAKKEKICQESPLKNDSEMANKAVKTGAPKSARDIKRQLRTSLVASWRPARTRVSCPECGQQRLPTIRSTADRYSSSAAGAAWVMTCWPFCFLPCLFTSPTKHHLHCSGCDAYLGLYDPDREVVGVNQKVRRTVRYRDVESKR